MLPGQPSGVDVLRGNLQSAGDGNWWINISASYPLEIIPLGCSEGLQ